ncbi:MAG TPA: hypothetical protein VGI45_18680 [Terracidiphilus sp.]|jgi:hypothetical protein
MALRNLLLRFAFGGFLAVVSFLVARRKLPKPVAAWTDQQFDRILFGVYGASHFLLFFTAFFVLHQKPWTDIIAFYVPQAHSVMHGLVPYRDFDSSYAPLNPYIDALVLRLHDSALSILAFQILCDLLSVPFWTRFLRRYMNEATVRKAALLYLVQPLVFYEICIDGKNQGLISLLLGISFWAVARREILSGFSVSLTWILVKILPIMFVPALFIGARKRIRWMMAAAVPSLIVYGAFVLKGADVTEGLRKEGNMITPQNLPYLFGALTGFDLPKIVLSLLSLAVIAVVLVITIRAQLVAKSDAAKLWKMGLGVLLILFAVLLMNKKSDTSYLGMCFFLLCGFIAFESDGGRKSTTWLYVLLSILALPIASFWYWPLKQPMGPQLHTLCRAGDRLAWSMLLMQTLLAVSYLGLAFKILRSVRQDAFESVEESGARLVRGSAS